MNNDYKNGYNIAMNDIINGVNDMMRAQYTPQSSIYSTLLSVKDLALRKCFMGSTNESKT